MVGDVPDLGQRGDDPSRGPDVAAPHRGVGEEAHAHELVAHVVGDIAGIEDPDELGVSVVVARGAQLDHPAHHLKPARQRGGAPGLERGDGVGDERRRRVHVAVHGSQCRP
jgi:hypothetical protein